VRTVDGYARLTRLPPASAPIQHLIDRAVDRFLPTNQKKLAVLPTVADFLRESELAQAFIGAYLSSAKVLGLVLSILKADRVRRGARALRRERACRTIVLAMRRLVVRRRVTRLQAKHAWWRALSDTFARAGGRPSIAPQDTPSPRSPTSRADVWQTAGDAPVARPSGRMRANMASAPVNLSGLTAFPSVPSMSKLAEGIPSVPSMSQIAEGKFA